MTCLVGKANPGGGVLAQTRAHEAGGVAFGKLKGSDDGENERETETNAERG
jgi:hypothetical protein